jgi:hypothetical protein
MDIDWNASEDKLHAASVAAIQRFAQEHAQLPVCFFQFDSEPRYGYVLLGFDTLESNIRTVKKSEQTAIAKRRKALTRPDSWKSAKYNLKTPRLTAFNTNSGSFAFPEYAQVSFPDWRELAEEGGYPVGLAHQDDYLESSVRLVLWRVAKRLVAEEAFEPLILGSPFMVGVWIPRRRAGDSALPQLAGPDGLNHAKPNCRFVTKSLVSASRRCST